MDVGQRVKVINGVLQGEKATVIPHPKSGQIEDDGTVFIRFDRDGAHIPLKIGYAILDPQWVDISRLQTAAQ